MGMRSRTGQLGGIHNFVVTAVATTAADAAEETGDEDTPELIEHSFMALSRTLRQLDPPEEGKLLRGVDADEPMEVWNSLQEPIEIGDRIKVMQEQDGTWSLVYKECV